ncbi:MAG: hypothetical protein K8T25_21890 [Planctomycetia bacterium]|nr:hypothetical protein [Planctomycetia bacterium]
MSNFISRTLCAAGFLVALVWANSVLAQPPDANEIPAGRAPDGAPAPLWMIKPSGLPAGQTPEKVLPAGVILHLRLKNAQSLLDNVSQLAKTFVPPRAVPPPLKKSMDEPNALLAIIGMQTMRKPLSVEALAKMSGIDPARPISLSVYPGVPDESFVLLLPVQDLAALSAMFNQIPIRGAPQEVALEGGSALQLEVDRGRRLFIVASQETVCVCGSRPIAEQLLSAPERLDKSAFISRVLQQHPQDNLVLIFDAAPLRPILPMLNRYASVPDRAVMDLRRELLSGMRGRDLQTLNLQLRKRLGVRDVNELLDYVECVLAGSYEVLAENLLAQAATFDGASLALNVSADFQRAHFSLYSRSIKAAGGAKPLPLSEVGPAIGSVPGTHNYLLIAGQSPPATKAQIIGDVLERIGAKMKAKQLPLTFHAMLKKAFDDYQPAEGLESKVPWTISSMFGSGPIKPDAEATLMSYVQSWHKSQELTNVTAFPKQQPGFLKEFIEQQARTNNLNDRVYRRLLQETGIGAPSYVRDCRVAFAELPGNVTKITEETSYTTQWGWFGYNEHELINRRFTLGRDVGNLTLLCPGSRDAAGLANYERKPIPPAIKRLLTAAHVPADANQIEIARILQSVNDVTDIMVDLETLVHKDASDFLAKANAIRLQGGSDEEILKQLANLEWPPEVFELKLDPERGFYVTTPVYLTLPRPKMMPEVAELFKDYRALADEQGGAVGYQRTRDGEFEVVLVQSTEALATLVRTVGDRVFEGYVQNPEGQAKLRKLLRTPLDETARRQAPVLVNPNWEFLPPTSLPLRAARDFE